MARFYPLKVKDIYKETEDCSVVSFEVPEDLKKNLNITRGNT